MTNLLAILVSIATNSYDTFPDTRWPTIKEATTVITTVTAVETPGFGWVTNTVVRTNTVTLVQDWREARPEDFRRLGWGTPTNVVAWGALADPDPVYFLGSTNGASITNGLWPLTPVPQRPNKAKKGRKLWLNYNSSPSNKSSGS